MHAMLAPLATETTWHRNSLEGSREPRKIPSLEFFSSQSENAIFTLLTFSITCCDQKWRGLPAPLGHLDFSRCPQSVDLYLRRGNQVGSGLTGKGRLESFVIGIHAIQRFDSCVAYMDVAQGRELVAVALKIS